MANEFDRIIKETLREGLDVLLEQVLHIKYKAIRQIDTKLQITDEREADFIVVIEKNSGKHEIFHIEFQANNDSKMAHRMLRYAIYLDEKYDLPIHQYLFYVGRKPLRMKGRLKRPFVDYNYNIINFKDIDCGIFINCERVEALVLSILCDYKGKDVSIFIREILCKIKERVKEETLRGRYIRQLEVLSKLRNLQGKVNKEESGMAIVYDIETDIRYRQGLTKGRKEGREDGRTEGRRQGLKDGLIEAIELAVELKFGAQTIKLIDGIKSINDIDRLHQIKELIRRASSIDEVISELGRCG
ncbi:hypothetical protein [Candidatus Magnetominusculus xianensis]|uniref:Transposase (Putative), YhgA-like protein n=1 Tax=Candidatus Magnetominusculus xianensis TaxID=1748249 RepID=A0ABR5SG47_9BACT|nr:hypothetical protein [Candidatus Magnetominusculus xianensis]KWT87093.1 hypothetical protein ASN18_1382 [Candidatus Magnetominusculus xianensis]MBF0404983.1 hypothetical protein [Nitrospirota bacterium]